MKRTAKQCLYGLVICAMIAGTVQAQDESSGSARVSDQPGQLPAEPTPVFAGVDGPPNGFFPMTPVETWFAPRFYFDSRAGTLYGYSESFTSVGGFVPYFKDENTMLFADARGLAAGVITCPSTTASSDSTVGSTSTPVTSANTSSSTSASNRSAVTSI
ncbi:MAG: hypothetical protein B7Z55_11425 [Planctomycetales bacterium 12-60-4]|nr:MAG: hypothetical protein B7Z55_11425 [Planctomycetales bacterium 12-60-4]